VDAWLGCIVNSTEIYLATEGYTRDYYSDQFNSNVSLDRNCACGSVYNDQQSTSPEMCQSSVNLDYTLWATWLNRTCTGASEFPGMPANWVDRLQIIDEVTYWPADDSPVPQSNLTSSGCSQALKETFDQHTSNCCVLDESNDYCSSTSLAINMKDFCSSVQFGKTCADDNLQPADQNELIHWMSSSCSVIPDWNGKFPIVDEVTYWSIDKSPIPDFANITDSNCRQTLQQIFDNNISVGCEMDNSVLECSSKLDTINMVNFCDSIQYGKTCADDQLSWSDQGELLRWMSSSCTKMPNWNNTFPIIDQITYWPVDQPPVPEYLTCMESRCRQTVNQSLHDFNSIRCEMNSSGYCFSTPVAVDMPDFCGTISYGKTCAGDCQSSSEQGDLMQWMSSSCSRFSQWNGVPVIDNISYWSVEQPPFPRFPGCTSDCQPAVNQSLSQFASVRCQVDSNRYCSSTPEAVHMPDFCTSLQYGKTCAGECHKWWERGELARWMNSTCSPFGPWDGLPVNWTITLFHPHESDLTPWRWNVSWSAPVQEANQFKYNIRNADIGDNNIHHCPSAGTKLGLFAAENLAMIIIMPILGRRQFIYKMTFEFLGHPDSNLWYVTGVLTLLLQIISNAANGGLIKRTDGFSSVNIGKLIVLWCTRPRLGWIVALGLLTIDAEHTSEQFSMILEHIGRILHNI
jgi:hypothetical protein